jgi:hypothetical protein
MIDTHREWVARDGDVAAWIAVFGIIVGAWLVIAW